MDNLPPRSLLLALGIILVWSFITALAKGASTSVNDKKLEQLSEKNEKAKRLHDYLGKNSSGLIGALSSVEYLLGFAFLSLVVGGCGEDLMGVVASWGIDGSLLRLGITVLVFGMCMTFLYLVFWKQVPERIAAKHAEKLSVALSSYSILIARIGKPLLWIPNGLSTLIAYLFGVRPHDVEEEITEEEIRMLVDIGSESGAIDDDEKEMIHNIFELDDKPVEDIMTHRKDVCILWMEDSIETWREYIDETAHTRYLVCDEDIDNVIGTVNSRDFYRFLLNGGQKGSLRSILREPYFVPDSMKADELFSRMQQKNTHMVVVTDEYGGFQGIVTQKDLLAEIVGELYSEDEEPEQEQEIVYLDENTWKIKGSAEIEEVEDVLGIKIPEGDYNTFAGLILDAIETLPEDGETVETEIGDLQIKVTSVVEHRIEEAVVCKKRELEVDEQEE